MVSVLISRAFVLFFGTLYPAYRSYKAVRTKDVREYVKWMMYWIVFACFLSAECIFDIFVAFWLPFYYELKIFFVFWLLSPWTKGASILYRKWIHPTLIRHERGIDQFLDQAKDEGYRTVMRVGSRGVFYARELITQAALKGANQLQQVRSYSVNDVSDMSDEANERYIRSRQRMALNRRSIRIEEIVEESDGNESEIVVRDDEEEEVEERAYERDEQERERDEQEEIVEFREDSDVPWRRKSNSSTEAPFIRPKSTKYATLPRQTRHQKRRTVDDLF